MRTYHIVAFNTAIAFASRAAATFEFLSLIDADKDMFLTVPSSPMHL
jgi:hypothetical protein